MFNITKKEIVYQFHYKIAKLTEGYQIPQSVILNSGQLPQSTSLLEEQQYHPKTKSSLLLAQQISELTHTVHLDRKILPFKQVRVGKQCNHYRYPLS